eukprot:TRINITY_DN6774_c0_g1_i1.p1 TRINITY_DN6774_c0_g1~~TRINITY_DN6774_c0_g1_i1.p1  ORF type:complete len:475 (-),score=102.44 TRINITY_DN6774_c0_g1_i1:82-1380(-)
MKSIAIVGAGPAGLTLARLIQQSEIDVKVTLFEKDASPSSRFNQGGTLDLHPETGLLALKKCGILDQASPHLRYEGEELYIADKNATAIVHMKEQSSVLDDGSSARPEIDREILKEILLKSVNSDSIQWGKHLRSVTEDGTLRFDDGSCSGPFDLVVGADGAWSKIRPLLSDVKPHFSGVSGWEGRIGTQHPNYQRISDMVGRGSYFCYSDGKSICAQRMGNETLKVSAWLKDEGGEKYPKELMESLGGNVVRLREEILKHFGDWDPSLRCWIENAEEFRPWPLYELPVGNRWDHRSGFTLIGDAASLMTPFAGEGVNKAMKDALELSDSIEKAMKSEGTLDEAVRKYEEEMFPRAKKYQTRTMNNKTEMFGSDAPISLMVMMIDVVAEEMGKDFSKGWLSWVPIKTMAWMWFASVRKIGSYKRMYRDWFRN